MLDGLRSALALALFAVALSKPALSAPPSIEAYGKLPAMTLVKIAPSGGRYAFVGTLNGERKIFVATTDGKPLATADIGAAKVRELRWAGDDLLLVAISAAVNRYARSDSPKAEIENVAVLNVSTGQLSDVLDSNGSKKKEHMVVGGYSLTQEGGRWYAYAWEKSGPKGFLALAQAKQYRVDLATGERTQVSTIGTTDETWLYGPQGGVAARGFYDELKREWRVVAGGEANGARLASGHSEFFGLEELNFGRTSDSVLFEISPEKPDAPAGTYGYRELPLSGGPARDIPDAGKIAEPIFDPKTELWIGNVLENDTSDDVFFAPAMQARWMAVKKAFPDRIAHLRSWNADFGKLVVFTDGGEDSGTYWLVDAAKHKADPLGDAYPPIEESDVGPIRMVDWYAADGLLLRGVLTLPPAKPGNKLPLVVLPHGGPEARDYLGFDWWAQAFASRGYAVFQPNYRGSAGYGVAFRNAGFGEAGGKMQTDISDGVAELARQSIIDPGRVCIVGASWGGYAALAGVTLLHGTYRCAVSVAGLSDPAEFLGRTSNLVLHPSPALRYWRSYFGEYASFGRALDAIAPAAQADHADAPILLIHGKDDAVVPIKQSEMMEAALKRAGKPVEFIRLDGEDHWLSREETRVQMLTAAVAFVQKYNPAN